MSNSYQDFYVFIFLEHRHFEPSLSPRYNNKGTSSQSPLSTLIHLDDFVGKEIVKQNEKLLSAFVFSYSFWLVLIGFLFFKGTFCVKECLRFCFVLVPLLASDFAEFGPDDPQSRFEFGAVVVCRIFHFVLELIPISAHIAISYYVTEFPYFLRKRIF